jgi:hypothetical protein
VIEELLKQDRDLIRAKINSETATIPWQELQRFFAGGNTLLVATELDLVDVACAFHQDEVNIVKSWTDDGRVAAVTDEQARDWIDKDTPLWAVVVKPWVLLQIIAQ